MVTKKWKSIDAFLLAFHFTYGIKFFVLFSFFFLLFNTVFAQENEKKKMQEEFENYKKTREVEFQDYKKQGEIDLKKLEDEYQEYYNSMVQLKNNYILKGDTSSANVVIDIIKYEDKIKKVISENLVLSNETKTLIQPKKNKIIDSINVPIDKIQSNQTDIKNNESANIIKLDNSKLHQFISPRLIPVPKNKLIITSKFGIRFHPILSKKLPHNGIDFGSGRGTKVFAADDGLVILSEYSNSFGNYIVIKHTESQSSVYAHLQNSVIKNGDIVKKGQVIGYIGSTGRSTGPHLHYEVRINGTPVNPKDYLLE